MQDRPDPLAQFRRRQEPTTPAAPQAQAASGGKPEYVAYKSQDRRSERLEIRRALGASHAPSYRYLMDVVYDGTYGTEIVLMYNFLTVKIKGRNLQPVIFALLESRCDFIQDFHPNAFLQPTEPTAPYIESIEFPTSEEAREDGA